MNIPQHVDRTIATASGLSVDAAWDITNEWRRNHPAGFKAK